MHARLIEAWLDSAGERTYQKPFCQMLAAKGHRILHSTRHVPIEFGKDVVTVDADGTPCAYQLKGNPGGRLTLAAYREIEPQLKELLEVPIDWPSCPAGPHRSFLVTNGQVEEDVRLRIEKTNEGYRRAGLPNRTLGLVQRGDLLAWAQELGGALWPSELEEVNTLLELMVSPGHGPLPKGKLDPLLKRILLLYPADKRKVPVAQVRRRIFAGAVLVSVSLKSFSSKKNHWAEIEAWTLYATYVIAACERRSCSYGKNGAAAVSLAMESIHESLTALAGDVLAAAPILVQGDVMADVTVYRGRYTLLLGAMAVLWMWCEEQGWPSTVDKDALESFLVEGESRAACWGEAAVPSLLAYYWFLRAKNSGTRPEGVLVSLLRGLTAGGGRESDNGLASPYYDLEDVARHQLRFILGPLQDPLRNQDLGSARYFALPVMHLLARTNLKLHCKEIWPELTRFLHIRYSPGSKWTYCLWREDEGRYIEELLHPRQEWTGLVDSARRISCDDEVPASLQSLPLLLLLFAQVVPQRATPSVVRALGHRFDPTWFIAGPIGRGLKQAESSSGND